MPDQHTCTNDSSETKPIADRSLRASLVRITRTLGIGVIVALSLLSFPSVLPWMIAFWIAWHTVLVASQRPAWLPLATCLAIMIAKLVPRFPSILMLSALMAVVVLIRFRQRAEAAKTRRVGLRFAMGLWAAWALMSYQWKQAVTCNQTLTLDLTRPVVCLGDSLTEGLLPDRGYPEPLQKMIRLPVVNLGFSGISAAEGLGQLERALSHDPLVIVIELGGHDFLKGHRRADTKANLVKMIETCRQHQTEVILMEIPRGFMFDPYASLEREIAYEQDVQLIADSWLRQIVIMSPVAPPGMWLPDWQLSDDGIHSNPRGSAAIAKRVVAALQAMYGDKLLESG